MNAPSPAALPRPAPIPGDVGRGDAPTTCPSAEAAMMHALSRLDPAIARWARATRRRDMLTMVKRIAAGITGHFKTRITEWFAAALLLQLGWTLVSPPASFPLSTAWSVMAARMPEETWGAIMLVIAGTRLLALGINGTFRSFRYSPHIRAATAVLACALWYQVVLSIWQASPASTALGIYRLVLALEIWNVWRAGVDTGIVERARNG